VATTISPDRIPGVGIGGVTVPQKMVAFVAAFTIRPEPDDLATAEALLLLENES
jgi:hypothetical protein